MIVSNYMRYIPYGVILLAYLAGLWIDIMEIDAAQYAVMARDMLDSGDLLHLKDRGRDYLDKPPLIFWCTALSYKLFGVSTFSYKLPSVLFALLGIFSTEKLARVYYSREKAFLAGLIIASVQGVYLMNNDVKTDMYLIGAMTFALWQLAAYLEAPRWDRLVLGFVGIGVGMLAKGPLGLVAPALALGTHLLLGRDWRNIFRWQWLVGLVVTGLVLLPFCIGLQEQFGGHGVRFFLWTQSFGRVTGESEWANDANAFFLVHTFAWAFLPWTILAVVAWGRRLVLLVKGRFVVRKAGLVHQTRGKEAISIAGFTLLFAALSLSRFKLPHYIFIVFPFAALMAGDFLGEMIERVDLKKWAKVFLGLHWFFFAIGTLAIAALLFWAFPGAPWWVWVLVVVGFGGIGYAVFKTQHPIWQHILPTAVGFAFLNILLNLYLYPTLLQYQSTAQAGKYIQEQNLPLDRVFAQGTGGRSMDFYAGKVFEQAPGFVTWDEIGLLTPSKGPIWIYMKQEGLDMVKQLNYPTEVVQEFEDFRVARLSLLFLNPATRDKVVGKRFLVKVSSKE